MSDIYTIILCFFIIIIYLFAIYNNEINENFYNNNYNIAKEVIYCFWTGNNPLSENRKKALLSIKKNTGIDIILVSPNNLNKYIKPDYPLHDGYKYLSEVHKADYLRTYFMHHYGGGYTDIKHTNYKWKQYFNQLNNSDAYGIGYMEIKGGSNLNVDYKKLIGNGSYIFKPNTPLTKKWYNNLINIMDSKLELLKNNPSNEPRDYTGKKLNNNMISKYPIAWSEILGDIFHVIIYEYTNKIIKTMPVINTTNYL
jgi:hypothetical protein